MIGKELSPKIERRLALEGKNKTGELRGNTTEGISYYDKFEFFGVIFQEEPLMSINILSLLVGRYKIPYSFVLLVLQVYIVSVLFELVKYELVKGQYLLQSYYVMPVGQFPYSRNCSRDQVEAPHGE